MNSIEVFLIIRKMNFQHMQVDARVASFIEPPITIKLLFFSLCICVYIYTNTHKNILKFKVICRHKFSHHMDVHCPVYVNFLLYLTIDILLMVHYRHFSRMKCVAHSYVRNFVFIYIHIRPLVHACMCVT